MDMKRRFLMLAIVVLISTLGFSQSQQYFPDPDPAIAERLEEWQDLKFGLLMHWGPYSQWGIVESWSICPEDLSWASGGRKEGVADNYFDYVKQYEALQNTFNPIHFDPERWAAAARDAGMKYVVFTTKHHDGFCMFDSKHTDYKITSPNTPFSTHPRSNVTAEIFKAFRAEGFWTGAYFSKPDWHSQYYWWPHFPPSDRNVNYSVDKHPQRWQQFVEYIHNQIDELMSDYGRVDILWLDGGWVQPKSNAELREEMLIEYEGSRYVRNPQNQDVNMPEIVRKAREKQPGLLMVDRAVQGIHQNYLTPEQHIPNEGLPYPWETCMTMANSWSYTPNDVYKSPNDLIEKLVDIVSKGGNYLLNIGPAPDGTLDTEAYDRLEKIGQWMKVNGEAIYATRPFEVFSQGDRIRFTRSKDNETLYVFLFDFPEEPVRIERAGSRDVGRVTLMANQRSLRFEKKGEDLEVSIPARMKDSGEHVWVLKID
jgi:alpha-L-fucosidase